MRYLLLALFLSGCVSQQSVRERESASARQYCYNVSWTMYGQPGPEFAHQRELEYQSCLRSLGFK